VEVAAQAIEPQLRGCDRQRAPRAHVAQIGKPPQRRDRLLARERRPPALERRDLVADDLAGDRRPTVDGRDAIEEAEDRLVADPRGAPPVPERARDPLHPDDVRQGPRGLAEQEVVQTVGIGVADVLHAVLPDSRDVSEDGGFYRNSRTMSARRRRRRKIELWVTRGWLRDNRPGGL